MSFTNTRERASVLVFARTLASVVVLVLPASSGCGPDVADPSDGATGSGGSPPDVAEPVDVQAWMLGVFSNREPVERTDYAGVQHYYVYDNFQLEYANVTDGVEDPGSVRQRTWEPRTADSFAMFPAEEEPGSIVTEYLVRPSPGASAECGRYEVVTIVGPEGDFPGPQPNPEIIIRGAVCQRHVPCPDNVEDPSEGCAYYVMEWCDEPPPPCEGE